MQQGKQKEPNQIISIFSSGTSLSFLIIIILYGKYIYNGSDIS